MVGHLDPDFVEHDGRHQEDAAVGLPHRQRDHFPGFGHRLGRDGIRDGESDRGGRRSRDRRQRRVRQPDGRSRDAAGREGPSGRGRMGQNRRARADRAGAQGGARSPSWSRSCTRRPRPEFISRSRRSSKMAHRARRADGGRRGDVARMRAAGDRRMADRRLLQLHAKRCRRAAGAVAGDFQRARDGSGAQAQDARAARGTSTSRSSSSTGAPTASIIIPRRSR